MSEVLWMGRARSTGIGNLIDGDLLSSLYIASPLLGIALPELCCLGERDSYLIQSAKSVMHNNWKIQ